MSDTIYRRAAIEAIKNIKAIKGTSDDNILLIDKAEAQTELMMLPTAEPERKKGKWTDDNACPFCGFQPWYERDIHTLSYCSNCGADMREGEKE